MKNLELLKLAECPLSVVIPTLGGDCLASTIEQLNRGTMIPQEILVCIPEEYANQMVELNHANVRIIKTKMRGQVGQRAEGFLQARGVMVLQLDDDIQLRSETIHYLMSALALKGRGNAVGPIYRDIKTGKPIHLIETGIRGWVKNAFYSLICGAQWGKRRMGTLTSAGIGFGVDPTFLNSNEFSSDWLPGGCVLSYKEDLVTSNFFPYAGKAYCEDFIHSYGRTIRGIKHWAITDAECLITRPEAERSRDAIGASATARKYFVKISSRSIARLKLYETISALKRLAQAIIALKHHS